MIDNNIIAKDIRRLFQCALTCELFATKCARPVSEQMILMLNSYYETEVSGQEYSLFEADSDDCKNGYGGGAEDKDKDKDVCTLLA